MGTTIGVIALVSGMVAGIGIAIGFDYRKWPSWLYVACGFVFGLFFAGCIVAGIIAALVTLLMGSYSHRANKYFKERFMK